MPIEFEGEDIQSAYNMVQNEDSKPGYFVNLLIKAGVVKNKRWANVLLVIICVAMIVLSFYLLNIAATPEVINVAQPSVGSL